MNNSDKEHETQVRTASEIVAKGAGLKASDVQDIISDMERAGIPGATVEKSILDRARRTRAPQKK
jgi:hypothetical protein